MLVACTEIEALLALEIEALPKSSWRDYAKRTLAAAILKDAWYSTTDHVANFADSFRNWKAEE